MNTLEKNTNRNLLHDNIIERALVLGSYIKEYDMGQLDAYYGVIKKEAKLDIVMGIPGSGKSSAIANPLSEFNKSLVIDADWVKEKLPEYKGGLGSSLVHSESKTISKKVFKLATQDKINIILPIVGKTYESILDKINIAKENGYTINIHYCEVSLETALERVAAREKATGRSVSEDYILNKVSNKPKENFKKLLSEKLCNNYYEYNNEVAFGEAPKITYKHNVINNEIISSKLENTRFTSDFLNKENALSKNISTKNSFKDITTNAIKRADTVNKDKSINKNIDKSIDR